MNNPYLEELIDEQVGVAIQIENKQRTVADLNSTAGVTFKEVVKVMESLLELKKHQVELEEEIRNVIEIERKIYGEEF
ncbi:hypothetical protein [Bacillus thuringiensis]|uniref:hypothetical protein n=1 Tax=Bacillus thuringiensis TaxID=1428 RepID=UPI000A3AF9F8|nr:hypothetical protein [Bacillus thuringiensis]OTZ47889.1 hypothetical protein BK762_19585 [Bacillus thuringiensis serovar toumanoffi]